MIEDRVKTILCDCLAVDEVNLGDRLNSLGADSLDLLDLEHRLEREFTLTIEHNDAAKWESAQDIVDFIKGKK